MSTNNVESPDTRRPPTLAGRATTRHPVLDAQQEPGIGGVAQIERVTEVGERGDLVDRGPAAIRQRGLAVDHVARRSGRCAARA